MLVAPLHVVDVVRHPRHGREGVPDLGVTTAFLLEVLDDVSEEEVILEDALHGLEEIRAERQGVAEGELPLAEGSHGGLSAHELGQYRHRPGHKQTNELMSTT